MSRDIEKPHDKGPSDFMGRTQSKKVNILLSLVTIDTAVLEIKFLVCHVILQDHVIKEGKERKKRMAISKLPAFCENAKRMLLFLSLLILVLPLLTIDAEEPYQILPQEDGKGFCCEAQSYFKSNLTNTFSNMDVKIKTFAEFGKTIEYFSIIL